MKSHPIAALGVVAVVLVLFAVFFLSFVTAPFLVIGAYVVYALITERRRKG